MFVSFAGKKVGESEGDVVGNGTELELRHFVGLVVGKLVGAFSEFEMHRFEMHENPRQQGLSEHELPG